MKLKLKAVSVISAFGGIAKPSIMSKEFETLASAELEAEKMKNKKCVPFLGGTFYFPTYVEILEA